MKEKTLIIIKPDALQRNLMSDIIGRFEKKGLKLVGMKMMSINDALIAKHYEHHTEKPFFKDLKDFMQASPVVVMAWQGVEAVQMVRQILGATSGRKADIGTIRGDLSNSVSRNLVHGSDSIETAEVEIKRFFKEDEIFDWNKKDMEHVYASDE
ncbi:MAG: nucleoside-diphosphate kinase [bacterium]|nr:nucleoside-diphosphate kinase [bacterium]